MLEILYFALFVAIGFGMMTLKLRPITLATLIAGLLLLEIGLARVKINFIGRWENNILVLVLMAAVLTVSAIIECKRRRRWGAFLYIFLLDLVHAYMFLYAAAIGLGHMH